MSSYTSEGTSTTRPTCPSRSTGARNAWCSFQKYSLELYDRASALLNLKIRMPKAEVLDTTLYGCIPWSSRACDYDTLRRAHNSSLPRCIGWRKNNRIDHPISCLDTLIKTESKNIEVIMRRRRILFAGYVARMEDTRLPKCVMFGELVGGAGCVRWKKKSEWSVFWTSSELSVSTPTNGRLQPRTSWEGARRRNTGRNVL
ncbi:unnamed protein product [Ascophyllum nodosum]